MKQSIARHRWRLLAALIAVVVVIWLLIFYRDAITREAIVEYGESLPALWLVVAALFLPLLGFSINVALLLVGVRFGFWPGMLVAAVAMAFHHLIAFWIGHGTLRPWTHDKMEQWGYKVPKIGDRKPMLFTLVFSAVHGPPYSLKLYLLALTEVPLRIYFWVAWPVHLLFAAIAVGAGSAVMDFDPTWIYVIFGGVTVLAIAGMWLQKKYGQSAEDREKTV